MTSEGPSQSFCSGYLQRAGVDGLVDLLVGQRVERGHGHVEQRQRPLERGLRGEAHVALQQVHLRQVDRDHLREETGRGGEAKVGFFQTGSADDE